MQHNPTFNMTTAVMSMQFPVDNFGVILPPPPSKANKTMEMEPERRRHIDACMKEQEREVSSSTAQTQPIDINIYRYNFSPSFNKELFVFAKIHQYDDRKVFKEAWIEWVEDNQEMVQEEIKRLDETGYEGDVLDKMFKSVRYYFRKKSTEKKETAHRRPYVSLHKPLLTAMDAHILAHIGPELKPSDGFVAFCEEYKDLLKEQVGSFSQAGLNDAREMREKVKKTYKNRYFIQVKRIKDSAEYTS